MRESALLRVHCSGGFARPYRARDHSSLVADRLRSWQLALSNPDHASRTLPGYRMNHGFTQRSLIDRLIWICATTPPCSEICQQTCEARARC